MSLGTSQYSWFKVALLLSGAVAAMLGCAAGPKEKGAGEQSATEVAELFEDFGAGAKTDAAPKDSVPGATQDSPVAIPTLSNGSSPIKISQWEVVTGGWAGNTLVGRVEERFVRPVAVAARDNFLYVVDEGRDAVLRYDFTTQRLEQLLDLKGAVKNEVADINVAPDLSFYITDTDGSRVLLYDSGGHLLKVYSNRLNLAKPVAVAIMEGGDIIVADGHFDHLARFNWDGQLIATYGGRGLESGEFLNITTMATGPDGMYVGTRIGRHVQVVGEDGKYRYSFEEGKVVFPAALVVDKSNRSYVADNMDNTIKVFDRGRLISVLGGVGGDPGRFRRVTDLWLSEQRLYVVDSLNARIQIGRLGPN